MTEPNRLPLEWSEPDPAAETSPPGGASGHSSATSPVESEGQAAETSPPVSTEAAVPASSAPAPPSWEPLTPLERRILGVLVEKQKTLSYAYPLSLNSLVLGCNQKDNRDPVMHVTEEEVEATLEELIRKDLVEPVYGGRVTHYRHKLYEKWTPDGKELAVLAELLLRGAQPRGLLRSRASRMDRISNAEELDGVLQRLAQRRLVVFLTPPQRRGAVVTHGFHTPEELARLSQTVAAEEADQEGGPPDRTVPSPAASELASAAGKTRLARPALQEQLEALTAAVQELQRRVERLEALLGQSGGTTAPDTASPSNSSA